MRNIPTVREVFRLADICAYHVLPHYDESAKGMQDSYSVATMTAIGLFQLIVVTPPRRSTVLVINAPEKNNSNQVWQIELDCDWRLNYGGAY